MIARILEGKTKKHNKKSICNTYIVLVPSFSASGLS